MFTVKQSQPFALNNGENPTCTPHQRKNLIGADFCNSLINSYPPPQSSGRRKIERSDPPSLPSMRSSNLTPCPRLCRFDRQECNGAAEFPTKDGGIAAFECKTHPSILVYSPHPAARRRPPPPRGAHLARRGYPLVASLETSHSQVYLKGVKNCKFTSGHHLGERPKTVFRPRSPEAILRQTASFEGRPAGKCTTNLEHPRTFWMAFFHPSQSMQDFRGISHQPGDRKRISRGL